MTLAQKLLQGVYVTIICMSIVFLVLVGLNFVIRIQRAVVEKFENTRGKKPEPKHVEPERAEVRKVEENEDEELVAVISAAVAAVLGRPTSHIIVRSIRKLDNGAPSWAAAGRQDQINSRF